MYVYTSYSKSCNKPAEQWKTTIDLPRMNLIVFPASACPTSLLKHQLWFSLVQFACCKTFAICCTLASFLKNDFPPQLQDGLGMRL